MESGRPDISVIVVFHNAETTIERTLRSLAQQGLPSVEYLFVDDGSSDLTVKVIESFMALNQDFAGRHRLIVSAMRRGSAHATSMALDEASGRYVIRCDADDYFEPDALMRLLAEADRDGGCDIVVGPYVERWPDRSREVGFRTRPACLNDFSIDTLHFSMCNKLMSLDLINGCGIRPFDGIDCWEDLGVVARMMAAGARLRVIDGAVLNYVQDPEGMTLSHSRRGVLLRDHLRTALLVENWMTDRDVADENEEFLNHLKFCAKVKMLRGRDKEVGLWKRTFPEVNGRVMSLRHIPFVYRLLFATVALLPASVGQWLADCCRVFYVSKKEQVRLGG